MFYTLLHHIPLPPEKERVFANFCKGFMRYILVKVVERNPTTEYVVNAPSVDSFKNRLDKQWSNEEILYDYKAATPAGRKPFSPAGTQDLTIEAKACGHEATYVNLSK